MTESEEEYCWDGYDEMLSAAISQTGKTVSAMLTELPDHDLEITIDVSEFLSAYVSACEKDYILRTPPASQLASLGGYAGSNAVQILTAGETLTGEYTVWSVFWALARGLLLCWQTFDPSKEYEK